MDQRKMVECIRKGWAAYQSIVNKEIHYVYKKNNEYKEFVLKAKKQDFMHLCGVESYLDPKTKKQVTANHFYNLVKSNNISPSFLVEKADGTTELKLNVIGCLTDLLTSNIRVIDGHVTFYNFSFDTGLRTGREIFALALIEESFASKIYSPYSLLNLKTAKANDLKKSYKVHSIYIKSRGKDDEILYESEEYKAYKAASELVIETDKKKTSAL